MLSNTLQNFPRYFSSFDNFESGRYFFLFFFDPTFRLPKFEREWIKKKGEGKDSVSLTEVYVIFFENEVRGRGVSLKVFVNR